MIAVLIAEKRSNVKYKALCLNMGRPSNTGRLGKQEDKLKLVYLYTYNVMVRWRTEDVL